MENLFRLSEFDQTRKTQPIEGPEVTLFLDWDDVDHLTAAFALRKMLTILNAHWNDAAYTGLNGPEEPEELDEEAPDYDEQLIQQEEDRERSALRLMKSLLG